MPIAKGGAEAQGQPADSPVARGTETILVADDHEGIRETTREVLEKLGYRVLVARDGIEAVQQFEEHRNDVALVLLDVVMPRLTGPDAYAQIQERKPGVQVIFTSGHTEHTDWLGTLLAQGALLLQKPYGPRVLARKVRELLDQRRN
jgi:CheY-like chemotaxis protein